MGERESTEFEGKVFRRLIQTIGRIAADEQMEASAPYLVIDIGK